MTKETIEKEKALELAVQQVEKRFGKGSVMILGKGAVIEGITATSTGSLALDCAIGIGGFPRGRIMEIFGPEASGKTTLALHMVAETQKRGGTAVFVDAEHALDPDYAKRIGVNTDILVISQPGTAEEALGITETFVRSGSVDIVVIDSVAALAPAVEIEGEMGDMHIGLQARLMSQAMRKLAGIVNRTNCTVLFINQLREKIGVMFGNPETTPGGRALKFYASVRLDIRRIGAIKDGSIIIGNRTKVKVVKNKVAAPFRIAEFDIIYNEGISKEGEILDWGLEFGLIEKAGTWYSLDGERMGHGHVKARLFLKDNPEVMERLEAEIREELDLL